MNKEEIEKIQHLIDYPCKSYMHDFSLINFKKGIWKCIHCPCQTTIDIVNIYHAYRYEILYKKEIKEKYPLSPEIILTKKGDLNINHDR